VRTDLSPEVEFASVRTVVEEGTGRGTFVENPAESGDDFVAGQRVAEIDGLEAGRLSLRVELLDESGAPILGRPVSVDLRSDLGITVVLARSCREIDCPAEGGDPALTACLAGRCVAPTCTRETPEACGPDECGTAVDCAVPVDCVEASCVGGACFETLIDGACDATEVCDPDVGCVPIAPLPDACVPSDCEGLSIECGMVDDGCGGSLDCGTCDVAETCDADNRCVCVDQCPVAGELVCSEGVQYTCADADADTCLDLTEPDPCPSGACEDDSFCSASPCSDPVATAGPTASGATVCNPDLILGASELESAELGQNGDITPIVIDGVEVSSCIMLDYGELCTPRMHNTCGAARDMACGADCGGAACTMCDPMFGTGDGRILRFVSTEPGLASFQIFSSTMVGGPGRTNCSGGGVSGLNMRYEMICRPACGDAGYNLLVWDVTAD
jgi:hypothetical protein